MTLIAPFIASFFFIALRAFQQRNVIHDNFLWVVPTSILMAATEAIVFVNIAKQGWQLPLVLAVGVGSGLGCVTAMYIHKRVVMGGVK